MRAREKKIRVMREYRKRMRFFKKLCILISSMCWFMAAAGADSYPAMTLLVIPAALFMYTAEMFRLRSSGRVRWEERR